jgi:hypothetical protein
VRTAAAQQSETNRENFLHMAERLRSGACVSHVACSALLGDSLEAVISTHPQVVDLHLAEHLE